MQMPKSFHHYLVLMRMDKPVGWLLLLWPTLWALWIANGGRPSGLYITVFTLGVIVMRSAGCVINDYADRDIDPLVARTKNRPIAAGHVSAKQALVLFGFLCLLALGLLILLPTRVWPWSIPAVVITILYPFMKRFIQAPQLVLGLAFSFSIPMVYVAADKSFDGIFSLLFIANFLWVLMYDTVYAMSDREDDLKIGVKSSAILFGRFDKMVLGFLQITVVVLWFLLMNLLNLFPVFFVTLLIVILLFAYQQWLVRDRERDACFQAFLNNAWVGGIIWLGLLAAL